MKTFVRKTVAATLKLLPAGSPERLYALLFRGFLGKFANPLIRALLPKQMRLQEGVVVLNESDPAVSGAIAFGSFEPYETELFRQVLQPGMTVLDVGANIGYYTVIAAKLVGDHGRVIAFEPAPENFAVLNQTIEANHFTNVSAHQLAVADKKGTLHLNLYESNKGKHSLVKDKETSHGFSSSIPVETVALDEFLATAGIGRVDIIKMDIEGAESLALQGMEACLEKASILFLEFTPSAIRKAGHGPEETLKLLRKYGFAIYAIHERTKSKNAVLDDRSLAASIPDAECANLYCEKE